MIFEYAHYVFNSLLYKMFYHLQFKIVAELKICKKKQLFPYYYLFSYTFKFLFFLNDNL